MNIDRRAGRHEFAIKYFIALVIKVIAAWICGMIGIKTHPALFLYAGAVAWILIDLGLITTYAARLNDIGLSLNLLGLVYAGHLFVLGIFLYLPTIESSGSHLSSVLADIQAGKNPDTILGPLSIFWLVGMCLRFILIFKKGQPDEIS